MTDTTEREAFEAAMAREGYRLDPKVYRDGTYRDSEYVAGWAMWQARAALSTPPAAADDWQARALAAQAAAVPAMQPREHETSADCWCNPEIDYTDPETGVSVYIHKRPQ